MEETIYKIIRIDEADYGCEERPMGYVPMVQVHLCAVEPDTYGNYEELIVEMEDSLMYQRRLDEGSKAVIGLDGALYEPGKAYTEYDDATEIRSKNQAEWMDNYLNALDELDGGGSV